MCVCVCPCVCVWVCVRENITKLFSCLQKKKKMSHRPIGRVWLEKQRMSRRRLVVEQLLLLSEETYWYYYQILAHITDPTFCLRSNYLTSNRNVDIVCVCVRACVCVCVWRVNVEFFCTWNMEDIKSCFKTQETSRGHTHTQRHTDTHIFIFSRYKSDPGLLFWHKS